MEGVESTLASVLAASTALQQHRNTAALWQNAGHTAAVNTDCITIIFLT